MPTILKGDTTMNNKSILEVVHESAEDLHDSGLIDDEAMREFDALCLKTGQSKESLKSIRCGMQDIKDGNKSQVNWDK